MLMVTCWATFLICCFMCTLSISLCDTLYFTQIIKKREKVVFYTSLPQSKSMLPNLTPSRKEECLNAICPKLNKQYCSTIKGLFVMSKGLYPFPTVKLPFDLFLLIFLSVSPCVRKKKKRQKKQILLADSLIY